MRDKRSAASDPTLDPLLERLAFLETANDGLKSRLSAGSFNVEMQSLALREQLDSARTEIARQQEALDGFCRETLAAGQARDQAQFIAQQTVKELDAAVQERDALKRRIEALEGDLELARRGAQDAEKALAETHQKSLEEAQAESQERLRALAAEKDERLKLLAADFAAREAALAGAAEKDRSLAETLSAELERARLGAQETERALEESRRQSLQSAHAETEERQKAIAAEFAEREALLLKTAENDRRRIETLEYQVEKTRRAAEQAKIIFQASLRAAQVESTERLMTLKAEYGKREAYLLKKAAENRRLLEEMIALEVGTERAVLKERALRRLGKKAPDAAPQPLEGLLDPVWAKVLPTLRGPVAAAFSRLRQIPLGSVPEGPRAMLRFAAVSLTQTSDMLKSLEEFYREDGIPAESRRAEAAIEAALASWEVPLRQRKISVIRRVEAGLPPVMVNEESLRVAVFQVLRNAYDAMPIGGSLTVALSRDAATGGVSARFSDTGPGFSPAALETLFAPFAGARAGHLGLGLGLARRILRRCGGDVEAGNNPAPAKGAFVAMNLVPQSRPRSAEMEP